MATQQGPLFPFNEPIAAESSRLVTPRWRRWLLLLREAVDLTPISVPIDPQLNQSASLATTSMDGGALGAGLYSISWYLPIVTTEAASTAQVTIAWVDSGVSKSYVASVVDGSVANNFQGDVKLLIYSDAASPITYAVTYVGATMVYSFRPVLQSTATS